MNTVTPAHLVCTAGCAMGEKAISTGYHCHSSKHQSAAHFCNILLPPGSCRHTLSPVTPGTCENVPASCMGRQALHSQPWIRATSPFATVYHNTACPCTSTGCPPPRGGHPRTHKDTCLATHHLPTQSARATCYPAEPHPLFLFPRRPHRP